MTWYTPLEHLNIAEAYLAAPYFWDSLIYLLIFLGLASFVFQNKKHFGQKRGKPVAIGIGLAMSIAMVVWEYRMGWTIGSVEMAVLPLTIIAILLFFLFYKVLTDLLGVEPAYCSVAISYLIVYSGMYSLYANPISSSAVSYPVIHMVLTLLVIASMIALIICVAKLFPSGGGGGGSWWNHDDDDHDDDDDDDGEPIEVRITEPPRNTTIPPGTDLEVEAKVLGGDGNHVWRIHLNGNEEDRGRRDRNLTFRRSNLPPGAYDVVVEAVDGSSSDRDQRRIVIGGGNDTGVIRGKVFIGPDRNSPSFATDAVVQLGEASGGGFTPINEPWARTTARGPQAEFEFDQVPYDNARQLFMVAQHNGQQGVQVQPPRPFVIDANNPLEENTEVQIQQQGSLDIDIDAPQERSGGCEPSGSRPHLIARISGGTPPYTSDVVLKDDSGNAVNAWQGVTGDAIDKELVARGQPLPDGDYVVEVRTQDSGGLTESDSRDFCIGGGPTPPPQPPTPRVIPLGPGGHQMPVHRAATAGSGPTKYVSYIDQLTNVTPVQFNLSRESGKGKWYQKLIVAVRVDPQGQNGRWLSLRELRHAGMVLSMLNTNRNPEEVLVLRQQRGRIETNVFALTKAAKTFQFGFGREADQQSFFQREGMAPGSQMRFYLYAVSCDENGQEIQQNGSTLTDGAFVQVEYQ